MLNEGNNDTNISDKSYIHKKETKIILSIKLSVLIFFPFLCLKRRGGVTGGGVDSEGRVEGGVGTSFGRCIFSLHV